MSKKQSLIAEKVTENSSCKRSICPLACTLDQLGDKWTLLVIRDLFMEKKLYSEFQASPEKIPSNILAERLKRLQKDKIIHKKQYQQHPPRYQYELTQKGRDLWPVLKSISQWGNQYIADTLDTRELIKNYESRLQAENKSI